MAENMSKCPYEDFIDRYLKNELSGDEQAEFEKHYFNCESCFTRTMETYEVVKMLRDGRAFDDSAGYAVDSPRPASRWRRFLAVFKRRR
jgi:anti-sigma factor RsiW